MSRAADRADELMHRAVKTERYAFGTVPKSGAHWTPATERAERRVHSLLRDAERYGEAWSKILHVINVLRRAAAVGSAQGWICLAQRRRDTFASRTVRVNVSQ